MLTKTKIDAFAWKETETITQDVTNETVFNVSILRANINQLKADISKRLADNIVSEQDIVKLEAKIIEGATLGVLE